MQSPSAGPRFEFYYVIFTTVTGGCASAQRSGTNDGDSPLTTVAERLIEELRSVLMPVKPEAKPAIDQILKSLRIHVIRVRWTAFCIVVPHRNSQPVLKIGFPKPH